MKKLFYFFALAALVLGMASCEGNDPTQTVPGALKGKFTIDEKGTQVQFSQGNLQAAYFGGKWTWGFATNQWDYVGNAAANTSINGDGTVSTNGIVDLFGWSTKETYYGIHNSEDNTTYSGDFADWGATMGKGWYTLSKDDWVYLFHERDKADELFGLGSVNGINGTIILPDDWTLPEGATFNSAKDKNLVWQSGGIYAYYYNANGDNFSHNTYTAEQWKTMETAGAVFLPAAGRRSGTIVDNIGSCGHYWSSTPDRYDDDDYAFGVIFEANSLYTNGAFYPCRGLSVRLVR